MIRVNGEKIIVNHYPDGTLSIKYKVGIYDNVYRISWLYDTEEELIALSYIVNKIRKYKASEKNLIMYLSMPYIPNARMDRVEDSADIFTLKYFANIINSLGFDKISVFDPHSTVSEALLNNISVESPISYVNYVLGQIVPFTERDVTIFYPDAGSVKRYSKMIKKPYVYGDKKRDWETGKILGLNVIGDMELIKDHDILIVDDICSKGGTFYHSAKKLKELGASNIYLYISHCENSILDGELINSGLVKRIYTTDTIFTAQHDLIEVISNYRRGGEND